MLQQQALLGTPTNTPETNQQETTTNNVVRITTSKSIDTCTGTGNVSSTPEDDSPSLGGHQSEDDGYMSMNGRKAKFALTFNPVNEVIIQKQELQQTVTNIQQPSNGIDNSTATSNIVVDGNGVSSNVSTTEQMITTESEMDFPPPPEEAERLIATLLPRYVFYTFVILF